MKEKWKKTICKMNDPYEEMEKDDIIFSIIIFMISLALVALFVVCLR